MNNSVDKFFRNKLAEHSTDAGVNTWSRIAEGLPKKNKTIVWYRAAAALIAAALTFTLWFYSSKNDSANETLAQSFQEQPVIKEMTPSKEQLMVAEDSAPARKKKANELLTNKVVKKKKATVPTIEKSNAINEMVNLPIAIATMEPNQIDPFEKTNPSTTKTVKPIVIVYELKEVANQIENPLDLDLSPQKKTGIRKVFEIANNVRNGDSPLGGLRQAKEEIFAFNFRKENRNNK